MNVRHKNAAKPFFRAAVKEKTLELMVYDDITGPSPWGDFGVSAKSVKKAIDAAGDFDRVRLRINSPGGDVFEGLAIYNLLRSLGKPIDVIVDGLAASSASIIAMAGDTIAMGSNALMMIHNAWTACVGYASDMRKMADTLDKVSDSIVLTYVNVTGKDKAEIKALMDDETWLSAEEAKAQGFATEVIEDKRETVEACGGRLRAALAAKAPDALRAKVKALIGECECDCGPCGDGNCSECDEPDCDDENCRNCPMQAIAAAADTPDPGTPAATNPGQAPKPGDGMRGRAELNLRERTLRLLDRQAGIAVDPHGRQDI